MKKKKTLILGYGVVGTNTNDIFCNYRLKMVRLYLHWYKKFKDCVYSLHFFSSFEIYNGLIHGVTAEGSGISVLRTFRLLRILKLVRFLPNLRRQLVVMLRTMDNVAVFFALLMLFIFIFRYYLIFLIIYIREKSGIDINNF